MTDLLICVNGTDEDPRAQLSPRRLSEVRRRDDKKNGDDEHGPSSPT